jgi:hypothetical protein
VLRDALSKVVLREDRIHDVYELDVEGFLLDELEE